MASIASAPDLPTDFVSALQAGWKVVGEESRVSDGKERTGHVILRTNKRSIQIDYSATTSCGYNFGKPRII